MDSRTKKRFTSPLRYPGSKKRTVSYFHQIIDFNKLTPDVFIEPFVGGGSVFLSLLDDKRIDKIIVADRDELIYSFWYVLFSEPESLINFIKNTKITLKNFYKYKDVSNNINKKKYEKSDLAKACLFLNRTSFSGMIRKETGPIGGKSQLSKYKVNCRFNKKLLIEKIKDISRFKERIIVLPYDWRETMSYIKIWLKKNKKFKNPLFYFDPPFFRKAEKLYRYYFNKEDHEELCKTINSLKSNNWILSYDNVSAIRKMYSKYRNMNITVPYSINSHATRLERELIISPLKLPKPLNRKYIFKMSFPC